MSRERRVVLIGNSVVASSLASTLRNRSKLDVRQFDAEAPEVLVRLREAHPDAVILCEPTTNFPDLIFLLLGEYPGIQVIGVDVDADRMVVISSRQAGLRTEDDLLEAIGQLRPTQGACWRRPEDEQEEVVGPSEVFDL